MHHKPLLFLTFLFFALGLHAQQDSIKFAVYGQAKVKDNSIYLKWMVNDPTLWKHSLTQGYRLTRTTILRDKQPIGVDETVVLEEKLLPKPLEEWRSIGEKDSMALVVAEALYGEDFQVTEVGKSMMDMMLLSEQNEQRYAFTLMASEQSFPATLAAGWGYIDSTAKPNEKYVYTVTLLNNELPPVQKGTFYIGLANAADQTPPDMPHGIFGDETVMLVWDYASQDHLFSSYNIERSTDGVNFNKINSSPIYSWDTRSKAVSYQDTLTDNTQKYYYRIRGIDSFGDESAPSEVFSGNGIEILEFSPNILEREIKDENNVRIGWEYPKEGEEKIKEFQILKGEQENGFFEVVKDKIPPTERSAWVQTALKPSNYFQVKALTAEGQYRTSFPTLVQLIDSIPPVPPIGFKGEIDTLGIVNLQWQANTEADLYGYKVFRGNTREEEFTQVTGIILRDNAYKDTISMSMIRTNDNVYYKFIAIDRRYNESPFSEILEVKIPDKIPPSQPGFSKYEVNDEGIKLIFIQSTSDDVSRHEIYRRSEKEKDWKMIHSVTDASTQYVDKDVGEKIKYYYTIIAIDGDDNESQPADPLIVSSSMKLVIPAIKNFDYKVDRKNKNIEMWWDCKENNVAEYQLYKRKKGEDFILYRIFGANDTKDFVDTVLQPGNTYEYSLRAVFTEGNFSQFKTIEVNY